ncbi:hypothetical protein CPC08DRAFT_532972 [Agrocybe pediades]|nr:hypothetical protein CPC08DRAFT_532972 [Agrocybe pediades]
MSMAAVESGPASNLESSTAAAGLARPPPLTQTDAITSLLSLSLAAAAASTVPTPNPTATSDATSASTIPTASSIPITSAGSVPSPITVSSSLPKTGAGGKHHRRLASTGQTRRRLSDAREAGSRPV